MKRGKFDPKPYRRHGISDEQIIELHEQFEEFDTQQKSAIEVKELKMCMQSLELDVKYPHVFKQVEELDPEKPLDFDNFLEVFVPQQTDEDSFETVERVFNKIGDGSKGGITLASLRKAVRTMDVRFTEHELLELIDRASSRDDQTVHVDDFYNIIANHSLS